MEYKSFEEIEVGDLGEDYGDDKIVVLGKGIGRKGYNKLKKFDSTGACEEVISDPTSCGYDNVNELKFVAAICDNQTYLYLEDGVSIYKNKL